MKNEVELAERFRLAKDAVLAVHDLECRIQRRKLFPADTVAAAKAWAEKLIDSSTSRRGQRLRKFKNLLNYYTRPPQLAASSFFGFFSGDSALLA
jgi:hypothetical protein